MSQPFADVLRSLGQSTYQEMGDRLHEVVEGVQETGKVGEITIKLKVKPNAEGSVLVENEIKSKVPEPPRSATHFFTTAGGGLVRNDPNQTEMDLPKVVKREAVND
ncbi:MAG: hypothetical protein NXI16_01525 [Alphaproteobacteria bacterium]|nr:hypothetical protein [Alphaproteobacteria bacterium]